MKLKDYDTFLSLDQNNPTRTNCAATPEQINSLPVIILTDQEISKEDLVILKIIIS